MYSASSMLVWGTPCPLHPLEFYFEMYLDNISLNLEYIFLAIFYFLGRRRPLVLGRRRPLIFGCRRSLILRRRRPSERRQFTEKVRTSNFIFNSLYMVTYGKLVSDIESNSRLDKHISSSHI